MGAALPFRRRQSLRDSPPAVRPRAPAWRTHVSVHRAADVDEGKIADIPGFGRSLTDKLVIWRTVKEKAFVYNAAAIVDPLEVQGIDRQLAARRTKLMKEMRERISEVERRVGRFNRDRAALWTQGETAFNARMLARIGA